MGTVENPVLGEPRGLASPLLRSKLRPPVTPHYFVPRARLNELLDQVVVTPLTLVVAPAGSGKSQLVSNWIGTASVPSAWLSLDESDDDATELWLGLFAAIEQLAPSSSGVARAQLLGGSPIGSVVRVLLDSLESIAPPSSVLILDDVHVVRSDAGADSLSVFAQHLPPWLHLVLIGRANPRLPLDRLRVRGQLADLRYPELRLSPAEARLVLSRLVPELADEELDAVAARSDGWAAGVQLAGLAARSERARRVPSAGDAGAQLTHDYVWHEILAAGDPDVVDLLLQTSVIDRVNADLAAAITGAANAGDLLLRAEAQGLFVHRIGPDRWFRVHALVREALLDELARQSRAVDCHARCAAWMEDAGETVGALEQWLLAGRHRDALRLVAARSTELYDGGRESTIIRTIGAISQDVAMADLGSMIDFAVSQLLVSREKFLGAVADAERFLERSGTDAASEQLSTLRSIAMVITGEWIRGGHLAEAAIAELGESWSQDTAGRFAWNTAARAIALSESWDDDLPLVRDAMFAMSRDPLRRVSLEGIRALGEAFAGRPVDALRVAAGVHHAVSHMSILRSEISIAEAIARLELGDRSRANDELHTIADDHADPRLYCPVIAMLQLAEAAVDDGDLDRAAREMTRAEALVRTSGAGGDLDDWIRRTGTVVALAGDELDHARRWADGIRDSFWGPVSRARIELAMHEGAAALAALAVAEPRCVRHHVVRHLLHARSLPRSDDALAHVARAVELATSTGMLQTVATDGRDVMELIERAAWRASAGWLDRLRRLAAPSTSSPAAATPLQFGEALTDRERDVLRLLPSRLTLAEIAGELNISSNTLKFHLRVIYRKLGVSGRERAVAAARAMAPARSTTRG